MYTNPYNGAPYWSVIPLFGDILPDPYRVGDFPSPRKEEMDKKGWADWAESLGGNTKTNVQLGDLLNPVWFNSDDGGLTFRLEVVGFGREHVSIKITENVLSVSAARDSKLFDRSFIIPSPEKLDLSAISAKVEHGLLEIVFPAKKQEVKTIKVL